MDESFVWNDPYQNLRCLINRSCVSVSGERFRVIWYSSFAVVLFACLFAFIPNCNEKYLCT